MYLRQQAAERLKKSKEEKMIKKVICSLFVFIFSMVIALPVLTAEQEIPFDKKDITISMDLKDASLKDMLKIFSIQSGLNFIASEAVQDRRITLYLDKVPLKDAMNQLFRANNLSFDFDQQSNIFIVKDYGKLQIDTVTKVFNLKHATVSTSSLKEEEFNNIASSNSTLNLNSESSGSSSNTGGGSTGKWKADDVSGITEVVKKLLSPDGSVIEDYRTNSLVVTDTPRNMKVIAQTIAALDVSIPQVLLEVEMLDVSKNLIDKIGVKFTGTTTSGMFSAALTGAKMATGVPFPADMYSAKTVTKSFTEGSVDFSGDPLKIFFDFIKSQADSKILARPRVLTLNNETAEVNITTQEAIGTIQQQSSGGSLTSSTTSAERTDTGVSLRVTPQIDIERGEITMFVYPKVKDATTFNSGTTVYKDPEERSTKSVVRVKDGETVVLGGLIRHDRSETVTKVPILGDIPLLKVFFTHRYKDKDKERELIVFITPHIIKETGKIEIAQAKKVNIPLREQNTVSGIDRQAIVTSSLRAFEKK